MTYIEKLRILNGNYRTWHRQFSSGDQSAYEHVNNAKKLRDDFEDKMIRNKVNINININSAIDYTLVM